MNSKVSLISKIEKLLKTQYSGEGTGHDWWHIDRVRQLALRIGKVEKADLFIVELAALLHDIADWKFHQGDESIGPAKAREILEKFAVAPAIADHVVAIVTHISFKGAKVKNRINTLEGKVVQDADRLDAIGAIGIARVFAYGGYAGHVIYDPAVKPVLHRSKKAYYQAKNTSINHFYEKLLLLKDRMNTKTGRRLAKQRHAFLKKYLRQFFAEWTGLL